MPASCGTLTVIVLVPSIKLCLSDDFSSGWIVVSPRPTGTSVSALGTPLNV